MTNMYTKNYKKENNDKPKRPRHNCNDKQNRRIRKLKKDLNAVDKQLGINTMMMHNTAHMSAQAPFLQMIPQKFGQLYASVPNPIEDSTHPEYFIHVTRDIDNNLDVSYMIDDIGLATVRNDGDQLIKHQKITPIQAMIQYLPPKDGKAFFDKEGNLEYKSITYQLTLDIHTAKLNLVIQMKIEKEILSNSERLTDLITFLNGTTSSDIENINHIIVTVSLPLTQVPVHV